MRSCNRQIILITALVFISAALRAQVFARADSLAAVGEVIKAATEYEWVYFNDSSAQVKTEALLKKALCYKKAADYKNEIFNLQRINVAALPDSLRFVRNYELVLAYYLRNNEAELLGAFTDLQNIVADTSFARKARYLCVLVLVKLELREQAEKEFAILLKENSISEDSLKKFHILAGKKYKSERKAKNLSLIFPGAGQMYAGKVLPGILSAALVFGSAAYTVFAVMNGYYASAFFTGFSFGTRFYFGGMKYAVKLVKEKNRKKRNSSQKQLEALILNCTK
jgi:TM2 domain-containing membrane protein YozV